MVLAPGLKPKKKSFMRLAPDGQLFKGQELGALPAIEGEDDPEQDVEDGVEDDVEDEVPADAGRLRRGPKSRFAIVEIKSGAVFTTLYFLLNFRIG